MDMDTMDIVREQCNMLYASRNGSHAPTLPAGVVPGRVEAEDGLSVGGQERSDALVRGGVEHPAPLAGRGPLALRRLTSKCSAVQCSAVQ